MKKNDPDTAEDVILAHEIKNFFKYNYSDRWVSESQMKNHSRQHNKVFNKLVREGFIARKKTWNGYSYKWNAQMP